MKLSQTLFGALMLLVIVAFSAQAAELSAPVGDRFDRPIATFSIVARDSVTGELGVAVASRFFTVGNVVPWAKADVGAVATQAYCNTTFGPRGLELLEKGLTPQEIRDVLLRTDSDPGRRQFGIVGADGKSVTYTGGGCSAWAGGRSGPNYAVQGNILAGEKVVIAMEKAFLETKSNLADRMYAALLAGEAQGGDSRGKQSAALLVVKDKAGYGGFSDRAIDIRVDDHPEPFLELGRILKIAQMNYAWNIAWTAFTEKRFADALPSMERCAQLAPDNGEVFYDLAVIRLSNGDHAGSLEALRNAIKFNPKLVEQARVDSDLSALKDDPAFQLIVAEPKK